MSTQHLVKCIGEGNLYLGPLQIIDQILEPVIINKVIVMALLSFFASWLGL